MSSPYTVEFHLMGPAVAGSEYFSQSSELKVVQRDHLSLLKTWTRARTWRHGRIHLDNWPTNDSHLLKALSV